MCLLATSIPFVKCLFKSLAYFLLNSLVLLSFKNCLYILDSLCQIYALWIF